MFSAVVKFGFWVGSKDIPAHHGFIFRVWLVRKANPPTLVILQAHHTRPGYTMYNLYNNIGAQRKAGFPHEVSASAFERLG
jgi:hypothetical protein